VSIQRGDFFVAHHSLHSEEEGRTVAHQR